MWYGKNKAVTFSYDDGITQDIRLVEIFNKYNLKCTFNLNSGIMNESGSFEINGKPVNRMRPEGLAELYKGHEIAVHTLTHRSLTELSDKEIRREIAEDKSNLENIFGCTVCGMAYPYGTFDNNVIKIAKECGIKYSRTTLDALDFSMPSEPMMLRATCHHKNPRLFKLLKDFLECDGEAVFCLWGHSYEFDADDNWNLIEEFCQEISGRPDIFYGTNSQIYT